jgi:hypothetical protein
VKNCKIANTVSAVLSHKNTYLTCPGHLGWYDTNGIILTSGMSTKVTKVSRGDQVNRGGLIAAVLSTNFANVNDP